MEGSRSARPVCIAEAVVVFDTRVEGADDDDGRSSMPGLKLYTRLVFVALAGALAVVAPPMVGSAVAQVNTITLTATPNPVTQGAAVTLTATVTGPGRAGIVLEFYDDTDGLAVIPLGQATTNAAGVAAITISATSPPLMSPAVRSHFLTAENFLGSPLTAHTNLVVSAPYPLAVDSAQPGALAAAVPSVTPLRSRSGFPTGLAAAIAGLVVFQVVVGVSLSRRRRLSAG